MIAIIANPASAHVSARGIEEARRLIESRGLTVDVLPTRGPGDAVRLARESVQRNAEKIIAAGGDGTINEVVNGMAGTDIPLAILPMGTVNVFARELGIPMDIRNALRIALEGVPTSIPLGRITNQEGARYFALWAGIGFDGATVHNVRPAMKRLFGKLAFISSGLGVLWSWNPQELDLSLDGVRYRCHAAIISRIRKYAGDFVLSPHSKLTDPSFHVLLVHGKGRGDIVRLIANVLAGRDPQNEGVSYLKGKSIEISGAAHIQIDGEYLGETPARITVHPGALLLMA